MKQILKKSLDHKFILVSILLTGLYFFTRLYKLTIIPVFVDEAIYIRWSQVMKAEPTLRFLPLSDGKQPLFMWLTIPAFKLFSDPLFAARFISVLAGFGSLVGIGALTFFISRSRKITLLTVLLYILTPFTLFFDRMALADSLLSMFGIWALFLGLLLINHPRLDLAMLLGYVIGGATLTKSPGWYFLLLQPLLLLTLKAWNNRKNLEILGCWLVTGLITLIMYNILRLGPNFQMIAIRNRDYIFPFSEVLKHPLNPFLGHFKDSINWLISLTGIFSGIILILSLSFKPLRNIKVALLFWSLLPFLFQASIAKAYTSRYFLFVVPSLLVIISLSLFHTKNKFIYKAVSVLLLLTFLVGTYKSYLLITNPPTAPIPQNMKYGYFQEWTAGYGQKEVAQYLKSRPSNTKILVGTEGYFGTLPDGLQIYTEGHSNIIIIGIGEPVNKIPESLKNGLIENEVYLVVNKSRNNLPPIDLQNNVSLIAEYSKPPRPNGTQEVLQFYQILNK